MFYRSLISVHNSYGLLNTDTKGAPMVQVMLLLLLPLHTTREQNNVSHLRARAPRRFQAEIMRLSSPLLYSAAAAQSSRVMMINKHFNISHAPCAQDLIIYPFGAIRCARYDSINREPHARTHPYLKSQNIYRTNGAAAVYVAENDDCIAGKYIIVSMPRACVLYHSNGNACE